MVEQPNIEELQQAAAELLEDVNTDEEFQAQLEAELRAMLEEIYAELRPASPDETKSSLPSKPDTPAEDQPSTCDDSHSG